MYGAKSVGLEDQLSTVWALNIICALYVVDLRYLRSDCYIMYGSDGILNELFNFPHTNLTYVYMMQSSETTAGGKKVNQSQWRPKCIRWIVVHKFFQ